VKFRADDPLPPGWKKNRKAVTASPAGRSHSRQRGGWGGAGVGARPFGGSPCAELARCQVLTSGAD